jgi:hypothetical protein
VGRVRRRLPRARRGRGPGRRPVLAGHAGDAGRARRWPCPAVPKERLRPSTTSAERPCGRRQGCASGADNGLGVGRWSFAGRRARSRKRRTIAERIRGVAVEELPYIPPGAF